MVHQEAFPPQHDGQLSVRVSPSLRNQLLKPDQQPSSGFLLRVSYLATEQCIPISLQARRSFSLVPLWPRAMLSAVPQASPGFCQQLPKSLGVQGSPSQRPLQLAVLLLQMPQATHVAHLPATVFGLPLVQRVPGEPVAPAHLTGLLASLRLSKYPKICSSELLFFNTSPPSCISYSEDSHITWTDLWGQGKGIF